MIGAASAYALETTRKRREEEEAQAAAARAQLGGHSGQHLTKEEKREQKAEQSRAHDEKVQERKERQSWANPAAEKARLKAEAARDAAYLASLEQQKQAAYTPPPAGISPEAQAAYLHGGAAAQGWINNNVTDLRATYVEQEKQRKEAMRNLEEKKRIEGEREGRKEQLQLLRNFNSQKAKEWAEEQAVVNTPRPPKPLSLPGAEFAAKVVKGVQNFAVKTITGVQNFSTKAVEKVNEKLEDGKEWAVNKIETVKQNLTEPYRYLKNVNPPSWLSISGGPSLFEQNVFSNDYIGLSSGTGGFWKRFFYETQTVKLTAATTATRNPDGIVGIDITECKLSVDLGKNFTVSVKPGSATVDATIKHPTTDPNHYTEDVYGLDSDFMALSFVTATNDVTINQSLSTSDFEVKDVQTLEGKIRRLKGQGPLLVLACIAAAIWIGEALIVIVPFLPKLGEILKGVLH